MINAVIILIVLMVVGVAIAYIIREKKRGVKCIGCPYAQQCANKGKCSGSLAEKQAKNMENIEE